MCKLQDYNNIYTMYGYTLYIMIYSSLLQNDVSNTITNSKLLKMKYQLSFNQRNMVKHANAYLHVGIT